MAAQNMAIDQYHPEKMRFQMGLSPVSSMLIRGNVHCCVLEWSDQPGSTCRVYRVSVRIGTTLKPTLHDASGENGSTRR
jgi:hypothetical protein